MVRYRLLILNLVLLLTLLGSHWGRRVEGASLAEPDFLRHLSLPFRDWKTTDVELSPSELSLLEPDATLVRRYASRDGQAAELAVIAGHRKRSVHTPGFCMAGSGWETISQGSSEISLPGMKIDATRALMSRENQQVLVTYYFTDGSYSTRNLLAFQGVQMLKRLRSQAPIGALVRIIVPIHGNPAGAETLCNEFAQATLPVVMQSLRQARLQLH